jgi:hypothetical protein
MKKLRAVLHKEQWTKKAPPADSVPLCIHWHEHKFRPLDLRLPPYITEEFPVLDADSDKYVSRTSGKRWSAKCVIIPATASQLFQIAIRYGRAAPPYAAGSGA